MNINEFEIEMSLFYSSVLDKKACLIIYVTAWVKSADSCKGLTAFYYNTIA